MTALDSQTYDQTGKVVLDEIYNKSDPRSYFSQLSKLNYIIPQLAKPVFLRVLDAYRRVKGTRCPRVVDLGCSYGVNAALLKSGMDLDELYELYGARDVKDLERSELIERDRRIFATENDQEPIEVVGIDAAPRAVAYAEEAEIIDDTVLADLERDELCPEDEVSLGDTDLIISTGCVGYISEKTIGKVLEANNTSDPWMAHFVLRMFSFEPIRAELAAKGYVTAKSPRTFRQRKFASAQEREQVFERLIDMGVDPSGIETDGWFHADLFVSRPVGDIDLLPSSMLVQ